MSSHWANLLSSFGSSASTGRPCLFSALFGKPLKLNKTRTAKICLVDTATELLLPLNLTIPNHVPGVDSAYLNPRNTWQDKNAYDQTAQKLAALFAENIKRFDVSDTVLAAGPQG